MNKLIHKIYWHLIKRPYFKICYIRRQLKRLFCPHYDHNTDMEYFWLMSPNKSMYMMIRRTICKKCGFDGIADYGIHCGDMDRFKFCFNKEQFSDLFPHEQWPLDE